MLASIKQIHAARRQQEGGGFTVRRAIGGGIQRQDPFLLLDHMGPSTYSPGEAVGAPDHPHRGFETVTYMLQGEMDHADSAGNSGRLSPNWVQWMTAGSGIIHSEMPSEKIMKLGGTIEGFQLWVNLPAKDKMIQPRYQDTPPEEIPVVKSADNTVTVKVIAGNWNGTIASIETRSPMFYLDVHLKSQGIFTHDIEKLYNAFAYIYRGSGIINSQLVSESSTILFDRGGGKIEAKNESDEEMKFILIGGIPLNEPVVSYGPFVMNTSEQIQEAITDFNSGSFGKIACAKSGGSFLSANTELTF